MLHWLAFVATGPAHRAANSHKCTSSRPLCLPCSMPQVQRIFRRHLLPFTKNSKRHRRTTSLSAVVMDYTDYLDVAKEAANLAGSILLEAWDKPRLVKHKGTVDLVRRICRTKCSANCLWYHLVTCVSMLSHAFSVFASNKSNTLDKSRTSPVGGVVFWALSGSIDSQILWFCFFSAVLIALAGVPAE